MQNILSATMKNVFKISVNIIVKMYRTFCVTEVLQDGTN